MASESKSSGGGVDGDDHVTNMSHAMEAEAVLADFGIKDIDYGLSSDQVQAATARYGKNVLDKPDPTPLWKLVLEQFEDPLVITLLGAMMISVATGLYDYYSPAPGGESHGSVLEALVEPSVILVILIFNAIVGVWQESNAEAALEALKDLQAEKALVIRDGQHTEINAEDVVPGDVVIVKVGDKVPADCRLVRLSTTTLRIEQASLTGESATVMKEVSPVEDDADIVGRHNILFASTGVANGRGTAVVVRTGMRTELGKIQQSVQDADDEEDTPLKKKIGEFGNQLQIVIFVVCVLVWVINIRNFFDEDGSFSVTRCLYYLKIAVALAVAAIPEGLPAVITTCLALGTRRMAKKNAIVRKLPSVETLGCTTVICSDKTGTLTTNKMSAVVMVYADQDMSLVEHTVQGDSYAPIGEISDFKPTRMPESVADFAKVCTLCNESRIVIEDDDFKPLGEPTELALKVLAEKIGIPGQQRPSSDDLEATAHAVSDHWYSQYKRIAVLEFSRDRKSMSTLHSTGSSSGRTRSSAGNNVLFVKGASESVIDRCTNIRLPDGSTVPLDAATRRRILDQNNDMAGQALRCLALAIKDSNIGFDLDTYNGTEAHPGHKNLLDQSNFARIESGLTFVGLVGIVDPPRQEVRDSINLCVDAGIRVIVITGDNQKTAESICRQIGIFEDDEDLTGKSFIGREFVALPEADQIKALFSDDGGRVFSRAEPAHKQHLIRLLKSENQIVAMTGDGVNDAPALKAADIGVAMGIAGTEVAKEASDMILADDNFATIVSAVEEGRSIYNNTKAFIRYLISSNIGEVASIFITAALGLPEIMIPVQLLWVNLVTDGPPATALGFNPADKDIMRKPPRKHDDQLISGWVFFRYMVIGLYVGFATVGVFVYWFMFYNTANDGHTLVSWAQLQDWHHCDYKSLTTEGDIYFGFTVANSGGVDLGGDPCRYFTDGKIKAATMSLTVLVAIEMLNALNALSEDGSLLQMPPWANPWLLVAMVVSFGLHFVIMYIPVFADMFQIVPLDAQDWAICLAFSMPVIFIDEILKFVGRIRTNNELAARTLARKQD